MVRKGNLAILKEAISPKPEEIFVDINICYRARKSNLLGFIFGFLHLL